MKTCNHEFDQPRIVKTEPWRRFNMPHPVYPNSFVPMERQDFEAVTTCKLCGQTQTVRGYNSRDLETKK